MVQTCAKCSRANPAEATYCYFDGSALAGHVANGAGGVLGTPGRPFPNPFVFPAGTACRTFDELALACQEQWDVGANLLHQGYFENFFAGLGRTDLALHAHEAARFPDPKRGLDQLLSRLPTDVLERPRLEVLPRQVNLGQLRPGEDRRLELHIENQGMGLLCGSISSSDCLWVAVGDGGAAQKLFQVEHEASIAVHVRGKELRAGSKPLEGRLVIDSNGGSTQVTLRADVPVQPFAEGVLAGARSPRQLAEKAKAAPKKAAVFFESGAVARWYESNGWRYPILGPAASGLGAVQQFFEALGLTPPPRVQISDRAVNLHGSPREALSHTLEIRAEEKRPAYAFGRSDQPWLEVGRPRLNGRKAYVPLRVPTVPDREGETLQARVTVTANGNQHFVVPVTLTVGGSLHFAAPPAAVDGPASPVVRVERPLPRPSPIGSKLWLHAVPAGLLAVALLIVWIVDVNSIPTGAPAPFLHRASATIELADPEPRVAVEFMASRQRFGIIMTQEHDPHEPAKYKRLTYDESGQTCNTCVKIDGTEYLFGQQPGQWLYKERELDPQEGQGWASAMEWPERVKVTQTVMIVPNEQTRLLDTVLVHYLIENGSTARHKVGLRYLLDTFIGSNDGVPFTIPGKSGLLVDTMMKFTQKDIPDYIQALERPNLKNPGTIAHLGLKMPDLKLDAGDPDLSPMTALWICHWPDEIGSEVRWDWKARPMNDPPSARKDSCVAMFWNEELMPSHTRRALAFTYGLGMISSLGTQNAQLGITAGGRFRPGGVFTVTAYLKRPQAGQRVTIALPDGLALAEGQHAEQLVAGVTGEYTQVSWRVRVDDTFTGRPTLRVKTGTIHEDYTVTIRKAGLFD